MSATYERIVRERSDWRSAHRPTRTFLAVLRSLDERGTARVSELARDAGVGWAGAERILLRMRRVDLAVLHVQPGAGRGAWDGKSYQITGLGRELAAGLRAEGVL